MVPPGIEPGTQGFSVLCSTNWAMAPQGAHVSFAIAKVGSFSETTKFLPCFLVCFALFGSHFILSTWFCDEKALRSDPDGIQTHDLQNRNLTLYSAKLRSLVPCKLALFAFTTFTIEGTTARWVFLRLVIFQCSVRTFLGVFFGLFSPSWDDKQP